MKTISNYLSGFLFFGFLAPAFSADPVPFNRAVSMNHGYFRVDERVAVQPFGRKPTKLLRYFDQSDPKDLAEAEKAFGQKLTACSKVDADSFFVLNFSYTRDEERAFYRFLRGQTLAIIELQKVDADSFRAVDYFTARDKNSVWYQAIRIPDADPASFKQVHGSFYKDKNNVYYDGKKVEGADPESFQHLEKSYYRDKTQVYCGTRALPDADPEKFKPLALRNLGKDREHVYLYHHKLPDISATTFVQVQDAFYKDKNKVYLLPSIKGKLKLIPIEQADAGSFYQAVELTGRDEERCFVVDPDFNEIYTLSKSGKDVLIEKTIWAFEPDAFMPVKAGTVKAELKDGQVRFPKVDLDDAYKEKIDADEEIKKVKLHSMVDSFNKTVERFLD